MSDTFQVSGEIIEIYDVKIISDNFKKREFILKHAPNPEYPDYLKLEVVQNKTDLLDKYKVGQEVVVDLNLKGKKWEVFPTCVGMNRREYVTRFTVSSVPHVRGDEPAFVPFSSCGANY